VVDLARRIGEPLVRPLAEHFVARGVNRDDATGVAMLAEVALRPRRVLVRIAGGANERDGARREERLR